MLGAFLLPPPKWPDFDPRCSGRAAAQVRV